MSLEVWLMGAAFAGFGAVVLVAVAAQVARGRTCRPPVPRSGPAPAPVGTEAGEYRWCTEELRTTYHAVREDGSRRCWGCGATTAAEGSA